MFQKSAGRSSLGMIFNVDSHGDLRFCSKRRRYTVMTQLPASRGTPPYRFRVENSCFTFFADSAVLTVRVDTKIKM